MPSMRTAPASVRSYSTSLASPPSLLPSSSSSASEPSFVVNTTLQMLMERGLFASISSSHLHSHLSSESRTIYLGIDPTAPSLHIGNLVPIIALIWLVKAGHRGIFLIGGATGSIGDPSGKSSERPDMKHDELKKNINALKTQLEDLVARVGSPSSPWGIGKMDISIMNNETFYEGVNILHFLRDVGRYVRIGEVLARDSIKTRLPPPHGTSISPNAGLSYTEFSYQLLQAYDFHLLNSQTDIACTVQLGGSDQMGNISAGVELIRRKKYGNANTETQAEEIGMAVVSEEHNDGQSTFRRRRSPPAYGLTLPLLTTSSGAKLGKSAGNAIFLSAELCSDYDFYQYLLRTTDEDVGTLLKCLTLLSNKEIEAAPVEKGEKQLLLANEVTKMFRGEAALERAKRMTTLIHNTLAVCKGRQELQQAIKGDVWKELKLIAAASEEKEDAKVLKLDMRKVVGRNIIEVLIMAGLADSKAQARRLLQNGAYLNNEPLTSDMAQSNLTREEVALLSPDEGVILLRKGKRTTKVLILVRNG